MSFKPLSSGQISSLGFRFVNINKWLFDHDTRCFTCISKSRTKLISPIQTYLFSSNGKWLLKWFGTSLVAQWLGLHLPMQGVWVWSLVEELRSHMPHGQKKEKKKNQNIKQKRYCNKFNKDLKKMVNIKKKPLEKKRKKENSSSSDVEMCLKLYLQWPLSSIWYAWTIVTPFWFSKTFFSLTVKADVQCVFDRP